MISNTILLKRRLVWSFGLFRFSCWHAERGIDSAETWSYNETVAVVARPTQRIIKFRVHLQQWFECRDQSRLLEESLESKYD
jgi:hypothetical protein